MSRMEHAVRNIFFGVLLRVYQTCMPFLMRTIMIYSLGVSYVGLNGLFVSLLQILNIAELGIASAMTFSLYEPVAKNDNKKICEILKLYKKYYFVIGTVILFFGVILLPFLPQFVSGEIPADINLYKLFLLYLLSTVLSYWGFSYRSCILEAKQRNDMISKIQILYSTLQFVLQIIVLIFLGNYYAYIIVQIVIQLMQQFSAYLYTKKKYPEIKPTGQVDVVLRRNIRGRVKDLATAKFGSVILNSSDTVVISAFLGLEILAIYQNYYLIISAVISVLATVMYGTLASIGNSIVLESREKNYKDFQNITFVVSWIICVCVSCFLCLFQPFMRFWLGEDMLFPFEMVILFCAYFFVYEYNQLFNLYKDAAGLWHTDRFRPLLTSICNLVLNICLVRHVGIIGIILSTIISMLVIGMPWLIRNLFQSLFQTKLKSYMVSILGYAMMTFFACLISYPVSLLIRWDGLLGLLGKSVIAVLIPSMVYLLCYGKSSCFVEIKKKIFQYSVSKQKNRR